MQMYMKNTFLLLSWLILLPSGILANPIKEMLERNRQGSIGQVRSRTTQKFK